MSSPIWQMQSQGMRYSLSRPKRQQNFPGPGTIRAVILLVLQSNSASMGHPRLRQVQVLITSFCLNSQILMDTPLKTGLSGIFLTIYVFLRKFMQVLLLTPQTEIQYNKTIYNCLYLCYCSHTTIPRHTSQNFIAAGNLEWIWATLLRTEWTVMYL